jgi:hypothetical protein
MFYSTGRFPMKTLTVIRRVGVAALLAAVCAVTAEAQDATLAPTFGSTTLRPGFLPDPYAKAVVAGGAKQVTVGNVKMWVAKAPDFSVNYTKGILPLTFYVRSKADTTLLINLPDGTWVADDDSDGSRNPVIKLNRPQSGRYDIWVGTFNGGNPDATLYITELR